MILHTAAELPPDRLIYIIVAAAIGTGIIKIIEKWGKNNE